MISFVRVLCLWLFMICCAWHSDNSYARNTLPEYTLKAAYLYNFAVLTEWPQNDIAKNFNLCFFGNEDIKEALNVINGKQVNGLRISVHQLQSTEDVKMCQMIYIAETGHVQAVRIMQEIIALPVLTVTDDERLAEEGMTIFLRPEGQRIVFEIDTAAAKRVNLNISSRLLRLAR